MRKVLCFFINNISNSGGTERVVSMIANQLSRNNYSIVIITLFSNRNESFYDLDSCIRIETIFNRKTRGMYSFPFVLFRLKKILDDCNAGVIVNVDSILAAYTVPVCLFTGSKIRNICWEHFNYKISLGKNIRRVSRKLAARYCDDVITLTEKDKKYWTDNNAKINNIVSINNPSQAGDCEFVGTRENNKVLVSVGRLTYQKGYDLLIRAFHQVNRQRRDWQLQIVGDGEDHHELFSMIEKLGLSESVKLIQATKNIENIYRNSAMYVMSSRFEGFPMVLLEATSFGLPVISFDCDTGPGEIVNRDFGWLCKAGDVDALSETILHAFRQCDDPVTYNNMRKSAYMSSSRYSIDKIIGKWIELLEK